MARQKGVIKFKGSLGDVTYYKSKDGYLLRERGGVDAQRIANDPNFQRTRENAAEFGRASKSGQLLRNAFRSYYKSYADSRMVTRLASLLLKVIKTDNINPRGERNVVDGNLSLLTGFEFNIRGKLSTTFYAPYTALINRETGKMSLNISPFVPETYISAPGGTTHFSIVSVAAEVDFNNEKFEVDSTKTTILPWNNVETAAIEHENTVTAESENPLFFALGIEFYQEVNEEMYPLRNGSFNSLALIKIDHES